jgi:hypothetical protein
MQLRPLSSIDGRITELLVTMPPAPEKYVEKYHEEIDSIFGQREGTRVIKFKDYKPPKNPVSEGYKQGNSELKIEQLQDPELVFVDRREVVKSYGSRVFVEDYVGGYVEQLNANRVITNSEWAQDPFSVLHDGNGNHVFLQPMYSRKYSDYSDKFISLQLAMDENLDLQMLIRPTDVLLEGGNVLAGSNFIIAGKDMLAYNCLQAINFKKGNTLTPELVQQTEAKIKRAYGVEHIVWIGFEKYRSDWVNWVNDKSFSFQPAFHIDLFLTMGGRDADGNHILILGDPQMAVEMAKSVMNPEDLGIYPYALERFAQLDQCFEQYETRRPSGAPSFRIVRIPLLIHHNVIFSFNNGLTEQWGDHKQIFLPDYEIGGAGEDHEQLDPVLRLLKEESRRILSSAPCNFTRIEWVGPGVYFRRLAQKRGALNCITKVLKRS